jgi:hypothetical protein
VVFTDRCSLSSNRRFADADRIMKVLALRFAKYGLTSDFSPLHPEKARLADFAKPTGDSRKGSGSFTFLGFIGNFVSATAGRNQGRGEGAMDGRTEDRRQTAGQEPQSDSGLVPGPPGNAPAGAA